MDIVDERYKNGKIYKIVCNETGETYYGSTIQKLKYRISRHKNRKTSESKHIINRNNYYYVLIENYSCNNKKELETRERYYIENNDCINKIIPTRTKEEYVEDNKEKMKEYQKTHYKQNKENIKEQKKEYYHQNKEKINEKLKEKISCPICDSIVRKADLKRHQRTDKCLSKIEKLNTKTI